MPNSVWSRAYEPTGSEDTKLYIGNPLEVPPGLSIGKTSDDIPDVYLRGMPDDIPDLVIGGGSQSLFPMIIGDEEENGVEEPSLDHNLTNLRLSQLLGVTRFYPEENFPTWGADSELPRVVFQTTNLLTG